MTQCMNPYCGRKATTSIRLFGKHVAWGCGNCASYPYAHFWSGRDQDSETRRSSLNHVLSDQVHAAVEAACEEAGWDWESGDGVPTPYTAMRPIVLTALEAINPAVTEVVNQHEDMRERVAHLLWMIQPTQMPLEWMEAGHPTPQEICDYVTSALQAEAGGGPAGSSDAAQWPEPKPGNDLDRTGVELPDFDAATAYQEAAMAEQRARIAAEERLHRMITALDEPEANLVEGVAVALYESPAGSEESTRWRWDEHDDTVQEYWRIYARDALTTAAQLLVDRFGSTKP